MVTGSVILLSCSQMFIGSGGIYVHVCCIAPKRNCGDFRGQERPVPSYEVHDSVNCCGTIMFRLVFSHFEVKARRCTALLEDEISWFSWCWCIRQLVQFSKLTFKTFNFSPEKIGSVIVVCEVVGKLFASGEFNSCFMTWLGLSLIPDRKVVAAVDVSAQA